MKAGYSKSNGVPAKAGPPSLFICNPLILPAPMKERTFGQIVACSVLFAALYLSTFYTMQPATSFSSSVNKVQGGQSAAVALAPATVTTSVSTSSDPCAIANELPVVTNWSNAVGGYKYLASDPVAIAPTPIPASGFDPNTLYYAWGAGIPGTLPTTTNYMGTNWSAFPVSDATANAFTQSVCAQTGVGLKVLRPDATVANGRLLNSPGYMQAISGIPMSSGYMFTVVLPANWSASAPAGTYPILAEGFYDDNWFYGSEYVHIPTYVAQSTQGTGTGVIGIYWNDGADHGSRGFNAQSRSQFEELVNYVAQHFGGDTQRIALAGLSRGASSSLFLASDGLAHAYRIRYVYAAAPLTDLTQLSSLFTATFPIFYPVQQEDTGLENTWVPGWTYPAAANNPGLTGLDISSAIAKIWTGTSTLADLATTDSLVSPPMVQALKAEGTQISYSISGNDGYIPNGSDLHYAQALAQAGVPIEVEWSLFGSHGDAMVPGAAITNALASLMSGQQPTVHSGAISYRVANRASSTFVPFSPAGGAAPFTITAPQQTYTSLPTVLYFAGPQGTQFDLQVLNRDTGQMTDATGTISAAFDYSYPWNPQVAGHYDYLSLKIKHPSDTAWHYLSLRDTPSAAAERLYTQVLAGAPSPQDTYTLVQTLTPNVHPILPLSGSLNWGMNQVSPSVQEGQVDLRLTLEYSDTSFAGRELVLSAANPSASIQMSTSAHYSLGLEEMGVDHSRPYTLIETLPGGQTVDRTSWLFSTPADGTVGFASGTYAFTLSYNGTSTTRTVIVSSGLLTATMTINGGSSATISPGGTWNVTWSSTNGVSAQSYFTVDKANCGYVPGQHYAWLANTLSGSASGSPQACQAGATFTVTYLVTDARGNTATSTVTDSIQN